MSRRPRPACALVLIALLAAGSLNMTGCATGEKGAPQVTISTPDALPVSAGFVYREEVHAVRRSFSLESEFWEHVFPQAAQAFQVAHRFKTYDEAIRADVDLIIISKSMVHGAKKQFRFSILVTVRDHDRRLVTEEAYKEKAASARNVDIAFEAVGGELRDDLLRSREIRRVARRS